MTPAPIRGAPFGASIPEFPTEERRTVTGAANARVAGAVAAKVVRQGSVVAC